MNFLYIIMMSSNCGICLPLVPLVKYFTSAHPVYKAPFKYSMSRTMFD